MLMTFAWDKTKASVPSMVAFPEQVSKVVDKLKEIGKIKEEMK
jgi:hypothetical protein